MCRPKNGCGSTSPQGLQKTIQPAVSPKCRHLRRLFDQVRMQSPSLAVTVRFSNNYAMHPSVLSFEFLSPNGPSIMLQDNGPSRDAMAVLATQVTKFHSSRTPLTSPLWAHSAFYQLWIIPPPLMENLGGKSSRDHRL